MDCRNLKKILEKSGHEQAKTLAKNTAKSLTDNYNYLIQRFYAEYTPKFYKRIWELNDTGTQFYKNAHGRIYYGGVKISSDDMWDTYYHDSVESVLQSALDGLHGRYIKGSVMPYDSLIKYRDDLVNNFKNIK